MAQHMGCTQNWARRCTEKLILVTAQKGKAQCLQDLTLNLVGTKRQELNSRQAALVPSPSSSHLRFFTGKMEATAQSSNNYDYKNKSSKRKKTEDEKETEGEWDGSASSATVPRTRSQVAPDWTTKEALILVNEVAAVEGDCPKALSSYQRWNIIVRNCTAMGVSRPLSQCRNKWNSLLLHYNQIKLWDSDSSSPPYRSLPIQTRKDFGLPLNFDEGMFQAMDDYTRARNHQAVTDLDTDTDTDTDTERDPEADAELLPVIAKLGSKRRWQRAMPVKTCLEENHKESCPEEAPQTINAELETHERLVEEQRCTGLGNENPPRIYSGGPQGSLVEEQFLGHQMGKMKPIHTEFEPQESYLEKVPQKLHAEERPRKPSGEKGISSQTRKKKNVIYREKEQMMMVEKLCVNAELILAIVNQKLPGTSAFEAADFKSVEDLWHQADKVITCLGDIVNIVNQFPFLVQE